MWRLAYTFFGGMIITVLPVNAISVYLFHDVDENRIGRWNLAYAELCLEFMVFSLVVGGLVLFFIWVGRILFHLQAIPPNYNLALFLAVLVILAQYPIELAGRKYLPGQRDILLTAYLILSPVLCAVLLLRDSFAKLSHPV